MFNTGFLAPDSMSLAIECPLPTDGEHAPIHMRVISCFLGYRRVEGIKPGSPALQAGSLPSELPGKPGCFISNFNTK